MNQISTPKPLVFKGLTSCDSCELSKTRTQVVPGFGNHKSKIMFIAQSPGEEEDKAAHPRPLIGKSGQLLAKYCLDSGLGDLDDMFRTNVNLCHPPKNRKAKISEIKACNNWLMAQIKYVDPDIIVTLGADAMKALLPDEGNITDIRGNVFDREIQGRVRQIVPTIHPAFVLRNTPANGPYLLSDLKKVKSLLDGTYKESKSFRTTAASVSELLDAFNTARDQNRPIGIDLETDSLARQPYIVGFGAAIDEGNGLYVPLTAHDDCERLLGLLKPFLEDDSVTKVASNAKFEIHALSHYGIELKNVHDTMLQAYVLGTYPLGLKDAIQRIFNLTMIRIETLLGKAPKNQPWKQKSFWEAQFENEEAAVEYAAQDADASLRLYNFFNKKLQEEDLFTLYNDVERPFLNVIVEMESNGFGFSNAKLREPANTLRKAIKENLNRLEELSGEVFNPGSPPQTAKVLYEGQHDYRIDKPKYDQETKKFPPTDKTTLAEHVGNPLVRAILTTRANRKMLSTYVEKLVTHVEQDGRIHGTLSQTGTSTGRVAHKNPNLANIPARDREDVEVAVSGIAIRKAFIARPGNYIYCPDLSQIEMRIAAHLSNDDAMLRELNGGDIHDNTTKAIYKTTLEQQQSLHGDAQGAKRWDNMRKTGKTVGFGSLYGLTAHGLLLRTPSLDLTIEEAADFIKSFYEAYPGLRNFQRQTILYVKRTGYAETMLGRRRYLPDITASDRMIRGEAERAAINVPIQGSAADFFKIACINVQNYLKSSGLKTRMINQVHDEIVMEGPQDELDILGENIPPLMANAIPLKVPVKVDMEFGESWGDLKKWQKAA